MGTVPPDFIIVGVSKAGTTLMANMLDEHPDVFVSPIKETNFFYNKSKDSKHLKYNTDKGWLEGQEDHAIIDTLEKYNALFSDQSHLLVGEASPLYLICEDISERIHAHHPDVKIIISLRNPTDVSYANFVMQCRDGNESLDVTQVEEMLAPGRYENDGLHPFARHLEIPRYEKHIQKYIDVFGMENIHFVIFEEFIKNKPEHMKRLFSFLGVREDFVVESGNRKVNISAMPKSIFLRNLIQGSMGFKRFLRLFLSKKQRIKLRSTIETFNTSKDKPVLSAAERQKLDSMFITERAYVARLLGRDIAVWEEKVVAPHTII